MRSNDPKTLSQTFDTIDASLLETATGGAGFDTLERQALARLSTRWGKPVRFIEAAATSSFMAGSVQIGRQLRRFTATTPGGVLQRVRSFLPQ